MAKQLQLGYIVILDERCKGCELCLPACPVDIIKMGGEMGGRVNSKGYSVVEVTEMEKCIACNLCALVCPDRAIEVYRFKKPQEVKRDDS